MPLDYEGVGAAWSMLGTKALEIFDETTLRGARCAVDRVLQARTCGKCTLPEGTFWLDKIYERLETGRGSHEDIDKLLDI